jgi:ribosome-associated protein
LNLKKFYIIKIILNSLEQIKGTNIKIINLTKIENILFDHLIICSASSSIQVSSIVSLVKEKIFNIIGEKPIHIEGFINDKWVLMDYNNILVNIFQKSIRLFYDIETFWLKRLLNSSILKIS